MTSREHDARPPHRGRRIALVVALLALLAAAGAWAVLSSRGPGTDDRGSTDDRSSSATPSEPASPAPTPSPGPTIDPAVFAAPPVAAWETSAADLMGTTESGVTVWAPDPAGRENLAPVVVLAAWGGDSSAAIGLDRATGEEVWRQDFAGVLDAACHVLGDGRRTACTVAVTEGSSDHRVVTIDTATGEVVGDDTVAQTPRHVVAVGDDLMVAGSNVADGRLMASRGTPADLDRIWTEESEPGFVDATEYWGGYTTVDGRAAFEVSGSSMVVELATGDAQLARADGDGRLGLWPGGALTRTTSTGGADGTATTTVVHPDGSELSVPGSPWALLSSGGAADDVLGADDTAYDARTAEPVWTAPERDDALSTSYVLVDETVVQASWYEESAQLLALDAATGAERWRASARSYAQSAVHGPVLVLGSYWELTAIDLETGESPWQLAYESDMAGDDAYWDNTVEHAVVGDALVTVSYGIVRGYTFS